MAYDWGGEYVRMKKDEVLVSAALGLGAGALVFAGFMFLLGNANLAEVNPQPEAKPAGRIIATTTVDARRLPKPAQKPI